MPKAKMFKGKPVYDAKSPLQLGVKPEDIKTAKRKDPASCALARCAIRKKFVISARIGQKIALIEYDSHFERYRVNAASSQAVRDFDKDGTFVEADYNLLPIAKSERLTGKAHSPSGSSGKCVTRRKATRNIYKAKECHGN